MTRSCCHGHASGTLDDCLPCPLVFCAIEEAYYNPQPGCAEPARETLRITADGRVWMREPDGQMTEVEMSPAEVQQLVAISRQGGKIA